MPIDNSLNFVPINIAIITISDTRTASNDTSGDILEKRITGAGHKTIERIIIPDSTTLKNGVYSKFKVGLYGQGKSDQSNGVPSISDTTVGFTNSTNSGRYVTTGILNLNQWHHVAIRYGSNFNNGLLNVCSLRA